MGVTAPRHLVDWPWVQVDVECPLCRRAGRYRLARLAERYGAAVPLPRLLALIAADCRLPQSGGTPRGDEARCGIRYVVPRGGPAPAEAAARAGAPKLDRPGPKPVRQAGPRPTIGQTLAQGLTRVRVSCLGLHRGYRCHHMGVVDLAALRLPEDVAFVEIPASRRLRCSRCGARDIHVMPDWAAAEAERSPRGPPAVLYIMPGLAPAPRDGGDGPVAPRPAG